jgi:hypothetical protein
MDELDDLAVELDSPEATHIGPIGTALWRFGFPELVAWLVREN